MTEELEPKVALITGVTGQDGAYLAEHLLANGYLVHGIKRRASSFNTERVDHLYQDPHVDDLRFQLHYGDLTDASNVIRIVQDVQPNEIYNAPPMTQKLKKHRCHEPCHYQVDHKTKDEAIDLLRPHSEA